MDNGPIVFRVLTIMSWVNEGIIWGMNWLDLFWISCDKIYVFSMIRFSSWRERYSSIFVVYCYK